MKTLDVWLNEHKVGQLHQIDGYMQFCYLPEWLNADNAMALSINLPLQQGLFSVEDTRAFFAGLLPEGENRHLIARRLQVSSQNDFALLNRIGGECAGAVSLQAQGEPVEVLTAANSTQWLSVHELASILDELPYRPMLAGQDGLRLSLAGAQDKLPVVFDGQRIGLPLNNTPSTHILKPAIRLAPDSVFNEAFCLALAAKLGIKAVTAAIKRASGQDYLLVTRYDRTIDQAGKTRRLHQEDFCQALGAVSHRKYQNEGGPGLPECFALLRQATRPSAPHIVQFLDYVIFNAMLGNHDAHAKNFSLLYAGKTPVLAPLYDALCTAVYPDLTVKMAMKIGSKYKFTELEARHWDDFALRCQLAPAQVRRRVLQLAQQLPTAAQQVHDEFIAANMDSPILGKICLHIEQRCALVSQRLV